MTTPLKAIAAGGNSAELREWVAGDFLTVANGGTGGTTAAVARSNLGLGAAAVAAIVGTVSQSGGVPTGAIIQRGSNANGEFVRYADGTQECWFIYTMSSTPSIPGDLYWNGAGWTFPAAFIAIPVINMTCYGSNGGYVVPTFSTLSASAGVDLFLMNTKASATSFGGQVHMSAKGRWF